MTQYLGCVSLTEAKAPADNCLSLESHNSLLTRYIYDWTIRVPFPDGGGGGRGRTINIPISTDGYGMLTTNGPNTGSTV